MEQLGPTLTEFYSPSTSNERKQQIEQGLHAFQTQPTAVATVLEIVVSIVSTLALCSRRARPLSAVYRVAAHATAELAVHPFLAVLSVV